MQITCPTHPTPSFPPVSPSGSPRTSSSPETAPPKPPYIPTSVSPPYSVSSSPSPPPPYLPLFQPLSPRHLFHQRLEIHHPLPPTKCLLHPFLCFLHHSLHKLP